jgi:hypothetical protein
MMMMMMIKEINNKIHVKDILSWVKYPIFSCTVILSKVIRLLLHEKITKELHYYNLFKYQNNSLPPYCFAVQPACINCNNEVNWSIDVCVDAHLTTPRNDNLLE